MTMTQIGSVALTPVLDSVMRRAPGLLYRNTPAEAWAGHADLLSKEGEVEFFMGGYVAHSGDRVVVIDLGVGPDGWRTGSGALIPGGFMLDQLRVMGVEPEAVTDVVLTHLHPDHVGWASVQGVACFPHATYRCHQQDWAFFMEGDADAPGADPVTRALLAPLTDRFEWWDRDCTLAPGIDVVHSPGHTPGSTTVVISGDDGSRALLLGDVVHCPVELVDPEWETIADVDPALALATRRRLLAEMEGDAQALVGAAHFPNLRFGRLLASDAGRRWQPVA
jgi:glyoxylase-like metal-dependent hydrolase (beta-lactamase superfamily II)